MKFSLRQGTKALSFPPSKVVPKIFLFLLFFCALSHRVQGQIITTVAGNGTGGFSGDGGPATLAQFSSPMGLITDAAGNFYFASIGNHRVRRVDAVTGIITTVAGNGIAGSAGDGGPAVSAQLNTPEGLAVDTAGNLYVSEYNGHRIRRVDAVTGVITTVVGTGVAGFSGDGGFASAAQINQPMFMALDGLGNLYFGDGTNSRVRRVDVLTGIITTVAGNGSGAYTGDGGPATTASIGWPTGIALDAAGNLFVSDSFNDVVRRVDAVTGIITTVAGTGTAGFSGDGGPGSVAQLSNPTGLALDPAGNLFISDSLNHRVRRVDAMTGIISTFAGTGTAAFSGDGGPPLAADLNGPRGLAFDTGGNLYFSDYGNVRIRMVTVPVPTPTPTPTFTPTPTATFAPCADGFFVSRNRYAPKDDIPPLFVRVNLCRSVPYKLVIYNTAGEMVRILRDIPNPILLVEQFDWDGKNVNGEEVASGVYLIRLTTQQVTRTAKVVVVR